MSHSSSVFNRVPIDLPNRSGFNLDHENQFSATCGTLIPAYSKPVLPKDTISMGVNFQCQLPPMVSDFAGKIDAVFEAFFVPNRILWAGWEDFVTHPTQRPIYPAGTPIQRKPTRKPVVLLRSSDTQGLSVGPATLADYLGWKKEDYASGVGKPVDALPFVAYAMIYEHWYRDSRIQAPLFFAPAQSDQAAIRRPAALPYTSITNPTNPIGPQYDYANATYGDGSKIGDLKQRNWSKGYFTTASPLPQAGEAAEVTFDVVENNGAISIASLRSANSIQQWMERNNFSYNYADQIYAQYGIYPSSAKMDKPIFLGRVKQTVYTRSVMQTTPGNYSNTSGRIAGWTQQLGSKAGSSQAIGEGRLFENFTPSEHGFLFVIFSLVPHAYYGTGCARHLIELESEDIPFPLLAGMGDQPIYKFELTGTDPDENGEIFGYTDRYAHYKYDEDEVHGLLRDGQDLAPLALQRGFSGDDADLELSSEFLQIPIDALDQVQAAATSVIGYSCIVNSFFKLEKISTLPAYSLPTLGDLKNTHKGSVSRGGSRL